MTVTIMIFVILIFLTLIGIHGALMKILAALKDLKPSYLPWPNREELP